MRKDLNSHALKALLADSRAIRSPIVARIREVRENPHITPMGKKLLIAPLLGDLNAQFTATQKAVAQLVADARDNFSEREPEHVQRRVALMSADGSRRASEMLPLLKTGSNRQLIEAARAARAADDSAAAHAIRLEMESRYVARAITAAEITTIREQLAFPRLVERYELAVAELVFVQREAAKFAALGPELDWRSAGKLGTAAARLEATRAARRVPEHDGSGHISFTEADVRAMYALLGYAADRGDASSESRLFVNRIEEHRAAQRAEKAEAEANPAFVAARKRLADEATAREAARVRAEELLDADDLDADVVSVRPRAVKA